MKKNILPVVFVLFVVLTASCCVSCKTSEPEYIEVPTPVTIDIHPEIEQLFDARPNNSEEMTILPQDEVDSSLKLLYNSWQYQLAWERWEDYAVILEIYLADLADNLAGSAPVAETETVV